MHPSLESRSHPIKLFLGPISLTKDPIGDEIPEVELTQSRRKVIGKHFRILRPKYAPNCDLSYRLLHESIEIAIIIIGTYNG